jgi:hypothetical protein
MEHFQQSTLYAADDMVWDGNGKREGWNDLFIVYLMIQPIHLNDKN